MMEPDLTESFEEVLHPVYKQQFDDVVARLEEAGIPFYVAGGIAVGAYGEPRATKDIDILLPLNEWTKSGSLILVPPVDTSDLSKVELIVMPQQIQELESVAIDTAKKWEDVSFVSPEVLTVMKLEAFRLQDQADIAALLEAGLDERAVLDVIEHLQPERQHSLLSRFKDVLERVERQRKRAKRRLLR